MKALRRLHGDAEAQNIISRARLRDWRHGSGDMHDFALFVVDETRKSERKKNRTKVKP